METSAKLTLSQIVAAFEAHCESQYFKWEIFSVSDIVAVDGFTVATIVYTARKDERPTVCRWSYRYEESEGRVIYYFHDQSNLAQRATIPGS